MTEKGFEKLFEEMLREMPSDREVTKEDEEYMYALLAPAFSDLHEKDQKILCDKFTRQMGYKDIGVLYGKEAKEVKAHVRALVKRLIQKVSEEESDVDKDYEKVKKMFENSQAKECDEIRREIEELLNERHNAEKLEIEKEEVKSRFEDFITHEYNKIQGEPVRPRYLKSIDKRRKRKSIFKKVKEGIGDFLEKIAIKYIERRKEKR